MSHFLTLVLVDPAEPDPFKVANQLMRKYWAVDREDEDGNYTPSENHKCDGFVIGGRFDGVLNGKEEEHNLKPAEFQKRYGLDTVQPDNNVQVVSELPSGVLPYAVVTPEGQWFDRSQLSEQVWRNNLESLLNGYQNHLAVAIDCHS